MSKTTPFDWLQEQAAQIRDHMSAAMAQGPQALAAFARPIQAPAWLLAEAQQRAVLFLNHVLMQEPAARERLKRQKGRVVQVSWRDQVFRCQFTPAGLIDLAPADETQPDLILRATQDSPVEIAQSVMQGNKPSIHIEGDVQLAAEVNWLFDHVRWEPEEDLSRLIGDAAAHTLTQGVRQLLGALRQFVQSRREESAV